MNAIVQDLYRQARSFRTDISTRFDVIYRWRWLVTLLPAAGALLLLGLLAVWVDPADHVLRLTFSLLALLILMQAASGVARHRQLKLADFLRAEVVRNVVLEQETEAELRDIFQHHPIPMWIFERDSLLILSVNDAACANYGYSRSEFLRMDMRQLHPTSEVQLLEEYLAGSCTSPPDAGGWKHRRKDGSAIDVEVISHEMRWRGRMACLVAAKDVTRRLSAERRLTEMNSHLAARVRERTERVRRYAHKLRERKQELEMANRDLEMFCYSASHDLRTPLFVMSTFVTLFLEDFGESLPPEAVEHVRKIHAASLHMSSLIDDLMKLAKVSRNVVQPSRVNLSQLASAQVHLLRSKEPGRMLDIEVEDGLYVDADPGLLAIALENLLDNAWKYTSRNPRAHIRVGRGHHRGEDAIFVRDNGAGFDMHAAEGLFKPFRRLHSQDQFEGTGIGLAIVQRVIALHGGRVWAEAEPDKGASFYFTLGPGAAAETQEAV